MTPWSVAVAPVWTFTRMKRAPVALATASAVRASFRSTFTPTGSLVAVTTESTSEVITAQVSGPTWPGWNGTSP